MFTKSAQRAISKTAKSIGVEPAALLAVAEVESAGVPFWNVNGKERPAIRFEGHYFYKKLKGAKLKQAVAAGLASPKAGAVANPKSYTARYELFERAMKIDAKAAIESTSWGIGQVMGDHWKKLGYASAQDLMGVAYSGVEGQVEIMAKFIQKFNLADELKAKKWAAFAKGYNGPAYRKNRYDTKMANAYKKWLHGAPTGPEGRSETVYQIQKDLRRLGYYKGGIDGLDGPVTKAAVKAFQRDNGLVVDGKYGKMTDEAVDRAIAKLEGRKANNSVRDGALTTGTGVAAEVITEQAEKLDTVSQYSDFISYGVAVLLIAGVALTLYGLWRKYQAERLEGLTE
jgi:hypothetical protein